jgi:hypothetical protein
LRADPSLPDHQGNGLRRRRLPRVEGGGGAGSSLGCYPSLHLVGPAGSGLQLATDLRNARVPFGVFTMDRHLLGLEAFLPSLQSQASENRVAQVLAFPD